MLDRDTHRALKCEVISRTNGANGLEIVVSKLWWGKDETRTSVHVNPSTFSLSGFQITDLLAYLGFKHSDQCPFTKGHSCYSNWVSADFEPEVFAQAFDTAYGQLQAAEGPLQACGYGLSQPEGWGHFLGGSRSRSRNNQISALGDGHSAIVSDTLSESEDERFFFKFTFIDTGHEKGFVTHYRPKHLPVSSEIAGVFAYLGIRSFKDCPEFDFEPCYYRTTSLEPRGDDMWGGNVDHSHRTFGAHANDFSKGIEQLLAANATVEAIGMKLLPLAAHSERSRNDIVARTSRPLVRQGPAALEVKSLRLSPASMPDSFDVAISFAGTERESAEELANILKDAGFAVFYDNFYPEQLWGKNLVTFFDQIYRKKARFCVMFISQEYQARKWTIHEARSAQARAIEERGAEYILPVKVDDTDLDGLPPTIGYVPLSAGIPNIGKMLIDKLAS